MKTLAMNTVNLTFTTEDIRRMSGDPDLTQEMAQEVLNFLEKRLCRTTAKLSTPEFTVTLFNFTVTQLTELVLAE